MTTRPVPSELGDGRLPKGQELDTMKGDAGEIMVKTRENNTQGLHRCWNPQWTNNYESHTYDVCEAFSVPRVTARARERNLKGGWALDVAASDPITGRSWDLLDPRNQAKVRSMIRQHRPRLLILSPPCTAFSIIQHMTGGPSDEALKMGIECFKFALELAQLQARCGGMYILEHPKTHPTLAE